MSVTLAFLDVNIVVAATGLLGGFVEGVEDFALAQSMGHSEIAVLRHFASKALDESLEMVLVTSNYSLTTCKKKLVEGVRVGDNAQAEALEVDEANRAVNAYSKLASLTGGFSVKNVDMKAKVSQAQNLVAGHYGNQYGQVDHEDVTIIAACLAAIARTGEGTNLVLVTQDRGLLNCASVLASVGIAVVNSNHFVHSAN